MRWSKVRVFVLVIADDDVAQLSRNECASYRSNSHRSDYETCFDEIFVEFSRVPEVVSLGNQERATSWHKAS